MTSHRLAGAPLDFAALRSELAVPGEYPRAALVEARSAAASPDLPDDDATDIPLVTVDPTGSRDLDQAVYIGQSADGGYLVSYAIADVAAFVRPGSALDDETQQRGQTLYFPDERIPLHPELLSEGAASLLPGELRPAVLWQIALDATGEVSNVDVRRARVRSRAQLDYIGLQKAFDTNSAPDAVALLPKVGALRLQLARKRHAINLDLAEQQVAGDAQRGWSLLFRTQLPVEVYNSEISLLTGMCAATLMLAAKYGILRTVPPPSAGAVAALRRIAPALGVDWPRGAMPGDVLAGIDRANPKHVAFIDHAGALLRGSSYTPFDGAPPKQALHGGVAAPYAHVTAPLRRLADRYGSEICLAAKANRPVPEWVRSRVPTLPHTMQHADTRAHEVDRAVVEMTEAWLLAGRIGQDFSAVVLASDDHSATVAIDEPAVRARCSGDGITAGQQIQVRLVTADVASRTVRFERA